ncbi:MAG TPA: MFS transporter [Lacunisphaera sp.]|nr:MFS transporter [Lacunisphaera sp.]
MIAQPKAPNEKEIGMAPASTRFALAGLSLTVLLSSLNTSLVNVALPALTQVFGTSTQAAQWTVIAFVLAITTLIVGAGRLADIVGRKRLLLVGVALFTAAAGACALAPGLGWLVAMRFVQGIGAAVMMAVSLAVIGDLAPKDKAGRTMGLLGSMSAIGTALGPAIGGLLLAAFGWPAIFLINVPLGLATFALLVRYLPPDRAPTAKLADFDVRGTVLLALSLAAYALAMTRPRGGFGSVNLVLLGLALGGMTWFVRVQQSSRSPLVRTESLREGTLRSSLGMSLLVAAVMMSTLVVGPFYLTRALQVNAGTMGLVLSVGPLLAALVANPAGSLVDRIGTEWTTVFGLAGTGTGCLALAVMPESLGIVGYLFPVALMTVGYSLFQTANNTAVMRGAGPGQRGVVSGLLNLSRNLGLLTGAAFLGGVFGMMTGGEAGLGKESVALATRTTFAVATVFIGTAFVLGIRSRLASLVAVASNAAASPPDR